MFRKKLYLLFILTICGAGVSHAENVLKTPPVDKADAFMGLLAKGDVNNAYNSLLTNSELLKLKPQELDNAKKQLTVMVSSYGKLFGYERIKTKSWGTCITRYYYILKTEQAPLYFYITYYLPDNSTNWKLSDFNFYDNTKFLPD
jgi:hypothetical protein